MEIPKLIILLCCTYAIYASEDYYSHTIPVENYETELQVLDTQVHVPEPPVKVIKITKTVAVKIPVPYPVKVVEKVPYPVHVSKPYPVPVPQIVHVPQPAHPPANHQHHQHHEALDVPHAGFQQHGQQQAPQDSYNVQEVDSREDSPQGHSFEPQEHQSFGGNSGHNQNFGASDDGHSGSIGHSFDAPNNYYGYAGDNGDNGSYETKNRHHVIQQYPFKQLSSGGGSYGGSPYH